MNDADTEAHRAMRDAKFHAGPGVTSGEIRARFLKPAHRRFRSLTRCNLPVLMRIRGAIIHGTRTDRTGLMLINIEIKRTLTQLTPLP